MMKKNTLTILFLVAFAFANGFGLNDLKKFSPIALQQHHGLFQSNGEITKAQYAEFITGINKIYGEGSPKSNFVSANTSGNPADAMTGVSFNQVREFCIWATEETNKKLQKYKAEHPNEHLPRLVVFRLPSDKEFGKFSDINNPELTANKVVAMGKDKSLFKYSDTDVSLAFRVIAETRN
jgi:hypothetical protein